jgi:modulator of FtsH protease
VELYDVAEWHEMFVAAAGAAAALAGLVFVAVSINVERILSFHGLPERALQTILLLLAAVVVSLVSLIPQSIEALAVELLVVGIGLCAGVFIVTRAAFDTGGNPRWLISRVGVLLPGSLPTSSPASASGRRRRRTRLGSPRTGRRNGRWGEQRLGAPRRDPALTMPVRPAQPSS